MASFSNVVDTVRRRGRKRSTKQRRIGSYQTANSAVLAPKKGSIGIPIGIAVHLLQVYSIPSPGAVAPRELLFRSRQPDTQDASRATPRRARQLRSEEAELLIARYLAVRNIRAVAREFQFSRTTVARILTEHGIDASRGMSEAQVRIAAELYEQGLSSSVIGGRLGFDNHTILKSLRLCGVAIRPRSGRN
ncbi:MAG: hypothetical protein U1E24_14610 [Phenylobacterium sp.]|nr:hypothetical protein [Phenylobacterium sp.]